MNIRTIWSDLLNLFFPNLCELCKSPLVEGENQLCVKCLWDLPRVKTGLGFGNDRVSCLFADRPEVKQAVAFLYYEKGGSVQRLIHAFKYRGNKGLAFLLGRQMALELQKNGNSLKEMDVLLPVPLHKKKKRQRGYNQSEWIARGIQSVWNIPIEMKGFKRIRKTKSQTSKSVYERWVNAEDTFRVVKEEVLAGKRILLIDDVITTGATVRACMEALKKLPDAELNVLALSVV